MAQLPQLDAQPLVAQPNLSTAYLERPQTFSNNAAAVRWAALTLLVMAGSILRVIACFRHTPLELQVSDPARWWHEATHLFTIEPITAIDAFGYQLWLGIVAAITRRSEVGLALHNATLSLLAPWIWYRAIKEIAEDDDLALAGWALFCWLPSWIAIYSYTMSETLFLPLFGASLWLSFRARRLQTTSSFALAAFVWTLASATRVFALPLALPILLWVLFGVSGRVRKSLFASLLVAILVVPLSLRMHYLLRVWNPFGLPQMNEIYMESGKQTVRLSISRDFGSYKWLYEFGSPALYQEPLAPLSHWTSSRKDIVTFAINEDHGMADWHEARVKNSVPWRARLRIWAENYVFFNFAPSWPDNNPDRFWDNAAVALRWTWAPLGIFVLGYALWNFKQSRTGTGLMIFLAALSWLLTPLLPAVMEGRYRKPVEGLLITAVLLIVGSRRPAMEVRDPAQFERLSQIARHLVLARS